jgi:peroxiredoxin
MVNFVKNLLYISLCLPLATFASTQDNGKLSNGAWQGRLHRPDGIDIVFNFEVKDSLGKKIIHILNAGDRLLVDDVKVDGDSVHIHMPFFDSEFKLALTNKGLEGLWVKHLPNQDATMPFTAIHNVSTRFEQHAPAKANITGRWPAQFASPGKTDSSFEIGEFHQTGNKVYGTFLTTTGDDRFLEGIVDGDTLRLSTFDGSHVYYFTATVNNKGFLENGVYYYGMGTGKEVWAAHQDNKAELPDERTLTTVKPGQEHLNFTFKDLSGNNVSINDPRFKNKVVIITLMGSWCPNCMDETGYLSTWYKQHKSSNVEVIGLAYERTTDFDKSKKSLQNFLNRFDVQYPVLITGVTSGDPDKTAKTLPQLTGIQGFPTTIFIDKKGAVREVHTGFSGPGTGEHYIAFQKEFNGLVSKLLAE